MKRETVSLIKDKPCNAMLLICIRSYRKSVLRYKYIILDTYHPDTVYLRQQVREDSWLLFEAKWDPRQKKVWGNTGLEDYSHTQLVGQN